LLSNLNLLLSQLSRGLIVSCQAPIDSPLHHPEIIAVIAQTVVRRGAVAVRIDSPSHIQAVRQRVQVPIIGLWKRAYPGTDVYITPQFSDAVAIAAAGADIIAIDATNRDRYGGETIAEIVARIHGELGKPVMADIDTLANARLAAAAGADIIGTTLYGYTEATQAATPPGFDLLSAMVREIDRPIVCEGGISSPQQAKQALNLGADAVVVGTAITGIDLLTAAYVRQIVNS
jgi:N-acylglucosamine-6-phosphate 2-epimerase